MTEFTITRTTKTNSRALEIGTVNNDGEIIGNVQLIDQEPYVFEVNKDQDLLITEVRVK